MDQVSLVYFKKLYETGNVTRAAEELYISRQALSKSLKNLETMLGVQLFTRSKQGLAPTEAGTIFYDYAQRATTLWDEAVCRIRSTVQERTIRIVTSFLLLPDEVIHESLAYGDAHSGIKVVYDNAADYRAVLQEVWDGVADIGITLKARAVDNCACELVLPSKICFLLDRADPLAAADRIDFFHDLKGYRVLCISADMLKEMQKFKTAAGIRPIDVQPHHTLIENEFRYERTILPVPQQTAPAVESAGLVMRDAASFPVSPDAYMVYRKECAAEVRDFSAFLHGICQEYAQEAGTA